MKTYTLNMTLSTPKNIEESEVLDKLVQFAEDNNYLLGGGLQLVDEVDPKDHCNYSDLPSPSAYDKTNMEKKQTAVELLIEQIKSKADSLPYNTKENRIAKGIYVDCLMMAKQARGMEEQQIIDANMAGQKFIGAVPGHYKNDAEDYYKGTFNKD